ncbi:hypothetical protein [uncultured Sphingomonas sp.]|nr:hypothetical protein [uncultured Sphingomonas sp.]
MTAPTSRKARALRIAGLVVSVAVALLFVPILIAKTIADAKGAR